MKKLLTLAVCLSALAFTACEKVEGCTDPSSLNYNADATLDDGSCLYFADTYLGDYAVSDTLTNADTVIFRQYQFNITKVHRAAVTLNGFHNNTCSPKALVTLTEMTLEDGRGECGYTNFFGAFEEGTLRFTYTADTLNPTAVVGTAIWQQ